MAGKVFAKSSLIETETPDVINFADTRSSVVSGERQWRLLTHRLGAMGPGLFLQGRYKPAAILALPRGLGCPQS